MTAADASPRNCRHTATPSRSGSPRSSSTSSGGRAAAASTAAAERLRQLLADVRVVLDHQYERAAHVQIVDGGRKSRPTGMPLRLPVRPLTAKPAQPILGG